MLTLSWLAFLPLALTASLAPAATGGGAPASAAPSAASGALPLTGGARTYCEPQANSSACFPGMGFTGFPSASGASPFHIGAIRTVMDRPGMLVYSTSGHAYIPIGNGTLCIAQPVKRTPVQLPTGSGLCGGAFSFDFGAWIASGIDPVLVAGQAVHAQYWIRDFGDDFGFNLTDALEMVLGP